MAKPLVARIEVWDKLSCQASPVGYGTVDYLTATATEEILGVIVSEKLALTVTRATYALSALVERRILRVLYVDGTYDEYRIASIDDAFGSGVVTITALGILYDLAHASTVFYTTSANVDSFTATVTYDTPSNLLTNNVLPFAPTYVVLGTITPTTSVNPTLSGTPLQVASAIASAAIQATGTAYELRLVRNGATNYQLHLAVTGGASAVAYLRGGLNLKSLSRLRDTDQQTTRGYPIGTDGRRCGDAWWKVTAVSVNAYIEIADINGGTVNPIVADDQFNTAYYIAIEDSATLFQITDTDKANKRLSMNPTPTSPVGKWVRICRNSSGDQLSYVDDPVAQATYGIKLGEVNVGNLAGVTNWAKNGNGADWPGSLPVDWNINSGTAPAKVTTAGLWLTGGQSAYFAAGVTGALGQSRSIRCLAGDTIVETAYIKIAAFGPLDFLRFTNPNTGANDDVFLDGSVAGLDTLNAWLTYSKSYTITATGNKTVGVTIVCNNDVGDFYLDAIEFSRNVEAPTAYHHHSEAASLWLAMVAHLATNSMPLKSYTVGVVDLTRADGTAFPSSASALGTTVDLREPDELAITDTGRLLRVVTAHHDPVATEIVITTRQSELTQLLGGLGGSGGTTINISGGGGGGGGGGYNLVKDESTSLTARTTLKFTGAGVTAADVAGETEVTIPGGGAASLSTASIPFTDGDTVRRVTVTDAAVSASSKIHHSVRRPDTTDDSADKGYLYNANVVRVGSGAFDVLIAASAWGDDDPVLNPPNETVTLVYQVA